MEFSNHEITDGQNILADRMKIYIHNENEFVFNLLNFDSDYTFLEPLLFANYFNKVFSKNIKTSIEELCIGYISPEKRAGLKLKASTDRDGYIYIANYGYLKTNQISKTVSLSWDNASSRFVLESNKKVLDYDFLPILTIPGTNIEISLVINSLLEDHFYDEENNPEQEVIDISFNQVKCLIDKHFSNLEKAAALLKKTWPNYYDNLINVARKIVLFKSKRMVSFASRVNHGTIFLNVAESDNEVFFYTELIHQYGHVMLYSITANPKEFFTIDLKTPLAELNNNLEEKRSFYSAFHGLFTTTKVAIGLELLLNSKALDGLKEYEVIGRLVDNYLRLNSGLEKIDKIDKVLTTKGLQLYNALRTDCISVYNRNEFLLKQYDVSKQPFVFSFDLFQKQNYLSTN
ncbi:MAG: hypothetical protein ACK5PC_12740 [Cyclobacteriaceae bacterium]|jgi:hypothetical protein